MNLTEREKKKKKYEAHTFLVSVVLLLPEAMTFPSSTITQLGEEIQRKQNGTKSTFQERQPSKLI